MKDFLPAFTFSFVMAQLFPGAVTVLLVTSAYVVASANSGVVAESLPNLMSLYANVGDLWFGSTRNIIIFLFLAVATGMFLHGLDWMILGWETCGRNKTTGELDEKESTGIREFNFHCQPIWKQALLGPLWMITEIIHLLTAPALKWIVMEENVSKTNPKALPVFTWLQDFYLYFAQFYIHMSYSLLVGFFATLFALLAMGFSVRRLVFLFSIYALTSLFFLMGRTQMSTLFMNEGFLKEASAGGGGPTEINVRLVP